MASDPARTELLDVLATLHHDLGKYLAMPLRMLPRDANDTELRRAAEDALLRTLRSAHETRTAEQIYAAGRAKLVTLLARQKSAVASTKLAQLDAAVQRALAWREPLAGTALLVRAELEHDFTHVRGVLEDWLSEVTGD